MLIGIAVRASSSVSAKAADVGNHVVQFSPISSRLKWFMETHTDAAKKGLSAPTLTGCDTKTSCQSGAIQDVVVFSAQQGA